MSRSTLLFVAFVLVSACDRGPRDLREWRPTDHDQEPGQDGVPAPAAASASAGEVRPGAGERP